MSCAAFGRGHDCPLVPGNPILLIGTQSFGPLRKRACGRCCVFAFLEFRVHQHNSNPRCSATSAGRGLPCISFTAVFAEETSVSKFVLILP